MIPIRDYLPTRRPAFINTALIVANILFYVYFFGLAFAPTEAQFAAVLPYMTIPAEVVRGMHLDTLVTALFLHASLLHLGGNMLFLYIFGNNVEDDLGHLRYLFFYLAAGVAGGVLQSVVDPNSVIPSLGASGAIAGVLAAYVVLYPRSPVQTVVLLGFIPLFFRVPAIVVIGLWILLQFLSGYAQLGVPYALAQGGVGYFAHIGGFVAGLGLLYALQPRGNQQQPWL